MYALKGQQKPRFHTWSVWPSIDQFCIALPRKREGPAKDFVRLSQDRGPCLTAGEHWKIGEPWWADFWCFNRLPQRHRDGPTGRTSAQ